MQPLRERRRARLPNLSHSPSYDPHEKPPARFPASAARLSLTNALVVLQTLVIIALTLALFATTSRNVHQPQPKSPTVDANRATNNVSYDFFVTVYAYDRPRHLLNLLRDIAREADAARLKVGLNVLDDNSYGCDFAPVARNIFSSARDDDDDNASAPSAHDSDLLVPVPLPETLPCAASHRFAAVEALVHARQGWRLYVSKYRHGRRRYWHLVRLAHGLLRGVDTRFHLFLPDDDRLSHGFFAAVEARWHAIRDARKRTLMLHVEATREHVAVWTDLKPRAVGDGLVRVGWVESGNFVCTPALLQLLNYSFPRIAPRRWLDNPPISSGVGATLSQLLHERHFRMFRTQRSYVAHVGVSLSQMNARFRERNAPALLTRHFADGDDAYQRLLDEAFTVTASIASHWVRETALHSAVRSLAPQVDRVNVYLNEYDVIPAFLRAPYVTVVRGEDAGGAGTLGDVGKFYWCNNLTTDFHLTADDDIVYPPDYVQRLHGAWQRYAPPVVVGVHGIRIRGERLRPAGGGRGMGYYGSRDVWMGVERVDRATTVHIIGTGTMLYRVRDVGEIVRADVFQRPNMADVWFGLLAQRRQLPMVIVPRAKDWIREVDGTFEDSIYKRATRSRGSEHWQTEAARSIESWKLHEPTLATSV